MQENLENLLNNTIRLINDGTFEQLEGIVKNLGIDFFKNNIEIRVSNE